MRYLRAESEGKNAIGRADVKWRMPLHAGFPEVGAKLQPARQTSPLTSAPMSLPPALSAEARQAALEKAAVARRARAELKDRLKMGSLTLREVLDSGDKDEVVGKTKMLTILESLPGLGKVKARRLMEQIGIADTRRVRGLGDNQRTKLLEIVEAG